ncbi:MAG: 8-amino-7-oxononanoate synthase [Omnitrophica WOR_2 bacterium SM23_29]|nr:MAG: 8-amino-7-oxononanoate synthase [Omnitrophica WOR_2 bacterium SM23_29]
MNLLRKELRELEEKGLRRYLRFLEGQQKEKVIIDGKEVLNLCSNNYLGLANDERIKSAAKEAIDKYGIGSGASRLVAGSMSLHKRLEEKIAAFKEKEAALLFNSGYTANLSAIPALCGKDDIIFSDKLNHASIVDGILLSRAEFKRYPHKDMDRLEDMLRVTDGFRRKMIITDTIFSMDGDIAPLPKIVELAERYNAWIYIDEAHATGVLGKGGKGAIEHFGIEADKIQVQMGTLSKAVGSFGAFICGSKALIEYLINKARGFIYTTSLPPAICAASIASLEIIENEPSLRQKVWENIVFLRDGLNRLGFDTLESETPIIPVLTKEPNITMEFSKKLLEDGIFVQGIRPPTVPERKGRLRVTVMATHKKQDLERALDSFEKVGKESGII